jgi:uncharacterized membrane protein (DUF485 family)
LSTISDQKALTTTLSNFEGILGTSLGSGTATPADRFAIRDFEPLVLYAFPFRSANLLLIGFAALILTYVIQVARVMGAESLIMTATSSYLTLLVFVGYLFFILDHTARGFQNVPIIPANMVDEAKAVVFKEIVLLSVFAAVYVALDDATWRASLLAAMLVIFPIARPFSRSNSPSLSRSIRGNGCR